MYRKIDKGGIEINQDLSAGINMGITKPIYYQLVDSINYEYRIVFTSEKKYPADDHIEVYDKASFFKGFNEIGVYPGLHAKYAISFDFSSQDKFVKAIETGAVLDVFIRPIPIMAKVQNFPVFLSMFVSYRFGRVTSTVPGQSNNRLEQKLID
ncbi:MAG: hypothetical protein HC896_04375 [Bacteroidales bacterium]|nr:hypothetical protein [Bacteroidales bacterium]